MQNKKFILALALFAVFMAVWYGGKVLLFPHPEQTKNQGEPQALRPAAEPALINVSTVGLMGSPFGQGPLLAASALLPRTTHAAVAAAGQLVNLIPEPEHFDPPAEKIVIMPRVDQRPQDVVVAPPQKDTRRIPLGSKDPNSKYHLFVQLDSRGGSVRRVVLNKFPAVDERGQPVWEDPETKKVRKLEELVPVDPNGALSYLLYHFENADKDPGGDQPPPLETLGVRNWDVVEAPAA